MSKVTEEELIFKATGPRVTKDELEANVSAHAVFNAYEAITALGMPAMESTKLLTLAVVTTENGFSLVGESACAWPDNYDQDIGQRLALENAKNKLWGLMGYHLKQQLFEGESANVEQTDETRAAGEGSWLDRVRSERDELNEKLEKLKTFLNSQSLGNLPMHQVVLLKAQKIIMEEYMRILDRRMI